MRIWRKLPSNWLITGSFLLTVVILAAVALVTFIFYEQVTVDLVVGREKELTFLAAQRAKVELDKFSNELVNLARNRKIIAGDYAEQRQTLYESHRRLAVFDGGVVLVNNFGRVLASEPDRPEIIGKDWSDRDYFRTVMGSQSVEYSNALRDGPGGTTVVIMAVPVRGDNGEFVGALAGMFRVGDLAVSSLYASIIRLRVGLTGIVYLVDGNGRVIYHSESGDIGSDFSNEGSVQEVLKGNSGSIRKSTPVGREIIEAYAPIPGTSWGLVLQEDWFALTVTSRRVRSLLLVLLVLGMVLPAMGVAFFARQRQKEAVERERVQHELKVAHVIQQTLLPKKVPQLAGWRITTYWQPAREVGGDFYDFISLPDGKLGFVIGDVTDKGVPAALVMASGRSILRSVALQVGAPAQVLEKVNDWFYPDMPQNMFVTCQYATIDTQRGILRFANAGHNLPYKRSNCEVHELWNTGMPLGLLPNAQYEDLEVAIQPGECLVFYSDGLVEAHNPKGEMFGDPRFQAALLVSCDNCTNLIDLLLKQMADFTGPNWIQEDDVTIVTIERLNSEEEGS